MGRGGKLPYYRAFGFTLVSDLVLPELIPMESMTGEADLEIARREISPRPPATDSVDSLLLSVPKVGKFLIESGRRIHYELLPGSTTDDIGVYLLGSCFGAILQQRGYVVLHGNAVSLDGENCRIVVGHSGAGKSTDAAWQYLQGNAVLADDVCAVTWDAAGNATVIPAFPHIKLWENSARLLGIPTAGLRRLHHRFEKFSFPVPRRFQSQPYRLAEIEEISAMPEPPGTISGREKINRLLGHSYRFRFLQRMGLTAPYFQKVSRLAAGVPMRQRPRIDL